MIPYNSIVSTDFNKQIKFVYQICVLTYVSSDGNIKEVMKNFHSLKKR